MKTPETPLVACPRNGHGTFGQLWFALSRGQKNTWDRAAHTVNELAKAIFRRDVYTAGRHAELIRSALPELSRNRLRAHLELMIANLSDKIWSASETELFMENFEQLWPGTAHKEFRSHEIGRRKIQTNS